MARFELSLALSLLWGCGARSALWLDDDGESSATASTSVGVTAGGFGGEGSSGGFGGFGGFGGAGGELSGGANVSASSSAVSSTSVSSGTGSECVVNVDCDDGIECTLDLCNSGFCGYSAIDLLCDDGLLCTDDECDSSLGCVNAHDDTLCDDGIACTIDSCDAAQDLCENDPCDNLCDDGLFCNGVERCDNSAGCTFGPDACTNVACATSTCSEGGDSCSHTFAPSCTPPDVHLLVTDAIGRLYQVSPYENPSVSLIATSSGSVHLDIAILGSRWFVVDGNLLELLPGTNQVLFNLGPLGANSLGAGPDGMLYAASQAVVRIDPDTGFATGLGTLPPGHSSSGDIAFLGDRMFISTDSPCGGSLVEFDVQTGVGTVLGGDGLGCVYGLAVAVGKLYILNCDGTIGTFDPDSGEVKIFATTSVEPYGADALP